MDVRSQEIVRSLTLAHDRAGVLHERARRARVAAAALHRQARRIHLEIAAGGCRHAGHLRLACAHEELAARQLGAADGHLVSVAVHERSADQMERALDVMALRAEDAG